MLEVLLGSEGKRKIRLRRKTNSELFQLYGAQLSLRHRSQEALKEAKRMLSHFRQYLGEFPPSPETAAAFLAQFSDRETTTLYRYASIIKSFMEWYGEKLDIRIRLPETLPDYVETDDIEKLKAAMRSKQTHKRVIERNLLIIDLACKAGLRREEISNLKVRDVNIQRGEVVVRQGKGMIDRTVPLTHSLQQSLSLYLKGKQSDESIFNLTPDTISGVIRWAALKAGVDIHTHSLRHFFGQNLVDSGTDLETVRRLMGHKSLKTTQVYLGRTDKQRREAIDRLEKPVNEKSSDDTEIDVTKIQKEGHQFSGHQEADQLNALNKTLESCNMTFGVMRVNGIDIIRKHWGKFEHGISRTNFVELLTKSYPAENLGEGYFEAADFFLEHLSLLNVLNREQRRVSYLRTEQDITYWALTDIGRKIVRLLQLV